jgi:hypothetical protein
VRSSSYSSSGIATGRTDILCHLNPQSPFILLPAHPTIPPSPFTLNKQPKIPTKILATIKQAAPSPFRHVDSQLTHHSPLTPSQHPKPQKCPPHHPPASTSASCTQNAATSPSSSATSRHARSCTWAGFPRRPRPSRRRLAMKWRPISG